MIFFFKGMSGSNITDGLFCLGQMYDCMIAMVMMTNMELGDVIKIFILCSCIILRQFLADFF